MSKYTFFFANVYTPNWSEKVKNIVPWTYVINDLNGEEIIGSFYKKGSQKNKSKSVYSWKSNQENRR